MSAVFYIKRGDRGPSFAATLRDAAGVAIDLTTAAAVKLLVATPTPLDVAVTIVTPTEGTIRYDWAEGDTDTAGVFNAELEIDWGGGLKQTIPNRGYIKIYIDEDLG